MSSKPPKKSHPGRGGHGMSLHPLTPTQALDAILKISPEEAKQIREQAKMSEPTKKKRK